MDINLSDKNFSDRDQVQEELTYNLSKEISTFLKSVRVQELGLTGEAEVDVMAGALITLVTKNIAYSAANTVDFNCEGYLNSIFDAMRLMFIKQHRIFRQEADREGKYKNGTKVNLEFH